MLVLRSLCDGREELVKVLEFRSSSVQGYKAILSWMVTEKEENNG
jgi:hypothetical protein